jgi:CheY-like chemotaxis protein
VVIVDDEPENLDFTRFVLEREGFEVTCVASGRNALEQVTAATQLVILDLAMEGVDGIEVCRRLKERRDTNHVPVLVVTAMTGEEVRRQAAAAGADGFLTKPFGVAEFLRHVRLHLRGAAEAG